MKYEKPDMEIMKLETTNVICTSGLDDGTGNDYHESGGVGSGSTSTDGPW